MSYKLEDIEAIYQQNNNLIANKGLKIYRNVLTMQNLSSETNSKYLIKNAESILRCFVNVLIINLYSDQKDNAVLKIPYSDLKQTLHIDVNRDQD